MKLLERHQDGLFSDPAQDLTVVRVKRVDLAPTCDAVLPLRLTMRALQRRRRGRLEGGGRFPILAA